MKSGARRERGFSLVELMVGMAIGLIGITIITHLYLTNEKYKRSTTGAGTAQVNGAIALYTLERDLRMAGYGVNHSAALGCSCAGAGCSPIKYYYNGTYSYPPAAGPSSLPALVLAPVVITSTAGVPDSITLLYGNDPEGAMPTSLSESMPSPSAEFKVDGTAGFDVPNMVLVTQGSTCMLTQVTQVQASASHLQHQSGTSQWNPPGGTSLLPAFSAGATLFNLGNPTWRTYSINTVANAYKLQVTDVMGTITTAATPQQLVDDIVDLQAEYGRDLNGDGVVSATEWTTVTPANSAEWQQLYAVRIGVLARSGNYERPDTAGGPCTATTATPTWSGSIDPVTLAAKPESAFTIPGGLPSCYKYRVFETVIPLRNMIWRPA
jgi:type IV pilus assembly protein PilW